LTDKTLADADERRYTLILSAKICVYLRPEKDLSANQRSDKQSVAAQART
jgi:hypothetical protein